MNGQQLRTAREELGWNRQQLATETGLTLYKIHQIETGKRSPTTDELAVLKSVLLDQLNEVLVNTGETPAIVINEDQPDDVVRSSEWNGIRRGDPVRVKELRGIFRFLFHHQDASQEYVEVYGPENKPKQRSFDPKRIVATRREIKNA